jgi:hypothetical protein
MMSNPWLSIPLEEYEGYMCSPGVQQLTALAPLLKHALDYCLPESVAVLGIAGGNGVDRPLPASKALWLGVFAQTAADGCESPLPRESGVVRDLLRAGRGI